MPVFDQDGLRPTGNRIRETLFSWLQNDINNACCVDLFTGSGALAFEAASRGAAQVFAIDTDNRNIQALQQACIDFPEPTVQPILQNALLWLQQRTETIDILLLDPPFAGDLLAQSLLLLEQHPALNAHSQIYIEAQKHTTITLPTGWQWRRHKTTGDIQFGLAQHSDA